MSALDVITGVVVLAVSAMFLFIFFYVSHEINTKLMAQPMINSTPESVAAIDESERTISMFDYFVFVMFIAVCIGIIITSWFIRGHPIFMFIYFIIVSFAVLASIFLSNIWEELTQNSVMLTTLPSFPITNNIMSFLPIYATIIGFIGIVVMFGKPPQV